MKTFIAVLFCLLSASVKADISSGIAASVDFSALSVTGSTWVPVISSSVKGLSGVSVFNTAGTAVEIGIALSSAAANSETRQIIVPKLLSSVGTPGATYYPLNVGYGTRVSIRAGNSGGSAIGSGILNMSFYYN